MESKAHALRAPFHSAHSEIQTMSTRRDLLLHAPVFLGTIATAKAVANGKAHPPAGSIVITDFGAVGDSKTDCTAAIQRAIDKAAVDGSRVLIPAGNFLVKGSLILRKNVSLIGVIAGNLAPGELAGSVIWATGGRDHEDAPPLCQMESSTTVQGIAVFYPEQQVSDIHPYPWTFALDTPHPTEQTRIFDNTIRDITLINSYNGIKVGPTDNGRHRVYDVVGCTLRRGIWADHVRDIGRIENIHLHCVYWADQRNGGSWNPVFDYMQKNLEGFVFGRSDWEYVSNTFVFPAKIGYRFIQTANGSCNGQFSGIGADATEVALQADAIQHMGLLVTNGEFNSHLSGDSIELLVTDGCKGNLRFVNCGFWGPVKHNAVIRGDVTASFSDCYFCNNHATEEYSIVAERGKLQVNNCTFDAVATEPQPGQSSDYQRPYRRPPCIHLKPGVKHAIIRGNNGVDGVSILNEIGTRAVVSDNEPEIKAAESQA